MRPFCARAGSASNGWLELPAVAAPADVDLLELLQEAPEFLGMALGEAPLPRAVAVLPQSVSGRVLIAVDEAGKITIVGCPDQKKKEGINLMVGDLLAASGRLWHQPFAVLAEMFGDKGGHALMARLRSRVGGDFDETQLKSAIEKSLEEGKFSVTIVVTVVDEAVEEMMKYLQGMNLSVRLITYERFAADGLELVVPRVVGEEQKKETPVKEERGVSPFLEYTPTVPTFEKPAEQKTYEPFPIAGTTPKQQAILERLVYIEDLGLIRRGFEFFSPRAAQRPEAEGTVVVAVDSTRWPFPKPDEVIVVVRTGREHLAGVLGMKPQEVEDFLRNLPREERREQKGVLLLWARNPFEANQLINELRALKEVSQTRPPGVR